MELDDLRRQWQRLEPADEPVAFDAAGVARLLAQRSVESLEQLRQNARKDLLLNTSFLVVSLVLIFFAPFAWLRTMGGLLALVALLCIYYFYRKMGLLRGIVRPEGTMRTHLVRVISGLRALMRFYYRFTIVLIPVAGLVGMTAGLLEPKNGVVAIPPSRLMMALGLELIASLALYWPVTKYIRWYLQRTYGQHLDRLEASLRELSDESAG